MGKGFKLALFSISEPYPGYKGHHQQCMCISAFFISTNFAIHLLELLAKESPKCLSHGLSRGNA